MSVKALLAILSLPLLLVLSSCGDSDDPTRGIRKGTQVVYCWKKSAKRGDVYGIKRPVWLSDKSENTITLRPLDGIDVVFSKSDIEWMEKAKDRKRMPKKAEPEE